MKPFKRILICIFSAGWLVPAWLGIHLYTSFLRNEVQPVLHGYRESHSFPFLVYAEDCSFASIIWLGLVILYWSWRLTGNSSTQQNN